ncbi:MAG: PilZ domain-containing protein [Acidobacteriota bacterium]
MSATIVVIGPERTLQTLRARFETGGRVHSFTDAEAIEALEHIFRHRPRIVAVEREFSGTSRGAALIGRVKDDPSLAECEVRVVAHDASPRPSGVRRPSTQPEAELPPKGLQQGVRRAPRVRIAEGVEVLVDGDPAQLLDLSILGAQVVAPFALKPNQRVRVSFADARGVVRCLGSVAWASFEMPKNMPTRYRAGVEFSGANAEALSLFCEKHRRP